MKALVALPGPSAEPAIDRLRAVYEAFAARRIRYSWEEASDEAGRQVIRPPGQVLSTPRHGTCLDLAVTFAGACLVAGLRPVVVLVRPSSPGPMHAVVAVWLERTPDYPLAGVVLPGAPPELVGELQTTVGGPPGEFVVVDVVGFTRPEARTPTGGLGATFDAALVAGAGYLARCRMVVVDGGRRLHRLAGPGRVGGRHPAVRPAPAPSIPGPGDEPSPLRRLRADYEVVPFQGRDELTILDDRCRASLDRPAVKVDADPWRGRGGQDPPRRRAR